MNLRMTNSLLKLLPYATAILCGGGAAETFKERHAFQAFRCLCWEFYLLDCGSPYGLAKPRDPRVCYSTPR